jgi:hypothetical protein
MHGRLSRVASITAAALVAAVVGLSGSANAGGAGPPPLPPVESATDIGVVQQNPVINGRDGIISGLFRGRSIWTFGDTTLAVPGQDGDHWANNTLSWTSDLNGADGITLAHDVVDGTGAPTEFIPHTKAEQAYNYRHDADHCTTDPCGAEFAIWPAQVIPDEPRDRVLLPYTLLHRAARWCGQSSPLAPETPP